jgi:hypothetical protein
MKWQTFRAGNSFDRDRRHPLCALRPRDAPGGQQPLCEAFTAYAQAPFRLQTKAELMYWRISLPVITRADPSLAADPGGA